MYCSLKGRTEEMQSEERRARFEITAENEGIRLDSVLAAGLEDMSRSFIQKLFEAGNVTRNGSACSKKEKAKRGDVIELLIPEPERLEARAEDIPLDIVYEDSDVTVVNKPAGMVVHPAAGNAGGTLVNALLYRYADSLSTINGVIRPGIVHRIDKDTSGLLMVARNDRAHASLSKQLGEHSVTRRYTAIVCDNIKEDEGTVDAPIGRDPSNRLRNAVVYENSRRAVTHYSVKERFGRYTLIEARLETGRTHQIRVHMAYIKHPLLGDALYGPAKNRVGAERQMLHAGVLGFVHPSTGEYMEFSRPVPDDMVRVTERLRKG